MIIHKIIQFSYCQPAIIQKKYANKGEKLFDRRQSKHFLLKIFNLALPFKNSIQKQLYNHTVQSLFFCMEGLRRQNEQIQKKIQSYLQQIEKQKELNAQHETEIQTLLKFNERLLSIIENELNNNRKERDSLQPISQRSERQSDLVIGPIQSFIKARKFGPISQRGSATTNSLMEKATHHPNKLQFYGRDMQSQLNHSSHDQKSEYRSEVLTPFAAQANKTLQSSSQVKNEMLKEIQQLKDFKNKSAKFYDNKINEIKNLSTKLNTYKPIDTLNKINSKLNLSQNTTNLIKKIMQKV